MKFTGCKENSIELSNEIIKMYGCSDEAIAKVIGTTEGFAKSVREGRANLNSQQFLALLRAYGISEFEPREKASQQEKRMYAMITNIMRMLHLSILPHR